MGPGIALTFALGGLSVTVLSRTAGGADEAVRKARSLAGVLGENGLITPDEADHAVELLTGSSHFESVVGAAGLVVESTPESLAFKQELFQRLDRLAPQDAVLASNTSGLSITAIAARCTRPERVLTMHFWNPAHLIPLVEIVQGDRTSVEVVERVRLFLVQCGKIPVVVRKDRPGQLGNRLQMALMREAVHIVGEGIASAEDVDSVIRNGLGIRMPAYGTLEHMDITGVDLGASVMDYVTPDLYNDARAPESVREMVRRGDLGAKTGKGFYDWSVKNADSVRAERDAFVIEVLRYRQRR